MSGVRNLAGGQGIAVDDGTGRFADVHGVVLIDATTGLPYNAGSGGGGGGGDASAANQVTGNNSLATLVTGQGTGNTTLTSISTTLSSSNVTLTSLSTAVSTSNTTLAALSTGQAATNTAIGTTNTTLTTINTGQNTGNTTLASISTAQATGNTSLTTINTNLNTINTGQNSGNTTLTAISAGIGAPADAAATTDTGTFSLIALFKRLLTRFAASSNATSTALEASHVIKASGGTLRAVHGFNTNAGTQFILIFDSATVPADGATPVIVLAAAANSPFVYDGSFIGRQFTNGIVVTNSSTGATKTIGAADCWFDAQFV